MTEYKPSSTFLTIKALERKNKRLLKALEKAIQGYENLVELDILQGEYKSYTKDELIPELREALK